MKKLRGHFFRDDRQRFTCGLVPLARLNHAFALLCMQASLCVDFVDGGSMLIHQCPEVLDGTYSCAACARATFHLVIAKG